MGVERLARARRQAGFHELCRTDKCHGGDMNKTSSQRARQIFQELAELPASEQEAALVELSGDDADVFIEVQTLLSAPRDYQEAGDRAAMTVDPVHAPDPFRVRARSLEAAPVEEQGGTQIGPYRLLTQLGQGGFGSVFLAAQTKPVARTVALKIIKLGRDTRAGVARFEPERQALAMMDHPTIAKVFDAGATKTGRP